MAIVVNSLDEAWRMAGILFPTDYEKDPVKSERAGYPVYTSTNPEEFAWISDLGDRLEINRASMPTQNIWISKPQKFTKEQLRESLTQITRMVSEYLKIPEEISKEYKLDKVFGELAAIFCDIEKNTH